MDLAIDVAQAVAVVIGLRAGLIAITMALVFDQMLEVAMPPVDLTDSKSRRWLSIAGQKDFKSPPPVGPA